MKAIAGPDVPNSPPPPDFAAVDPREVDTIARETSNAYRSMVAYLRRDYHLSEDEALAKVNAPASSEWVKHIAEAAPDQVSWGQLNDVAQQDPALAEQKWVSIKQAALDELCSGHRSALAVEGYGGEPMERARFLAIRHELAREWQPKNGIENALIDQMAQAYSQYLHWMKNFSTWMSCKSHRPSADEIGGWQSPRVSDAEAIDTAAAMLDRFNRLFIRSLRALRDLRRYPVIVQNAEHVNIDDRQLNIVIGGK